MRFKITVGTDKLRFNHCVQMDTMLINGKTIFHMVHMATNV